MDIIWHVLAAPFLIVATIVTAPLAPISYGLSHLEDGPPVEEPYYFVVGPRYYSLKYDPLFWSYFGDEPEQHETPDGTIEIDEEAAAVRSVKHKTKNLRGDETR